MEDLYHVTYMQSKSITLLMPDRVIEFVRCDKMYVADFSYWLEVEDEEDYDCKSDGEELELILMTVKERESTYTSKEVCKALEAGEFLKAIGYPSLKGAVHMVQNGKLLNVPYSADDVRKYFDTCRTQVEAVRGKMAKMHAKHPTREDSKMREQHTMQELV